MCGIAGFISKTENSAGVLSRMLDRIAHRGPDGSGQWISRVRDREIHLGHRRLAIIDIGGGKQPMTNGDGSVCLTYNGEIYNHTALRGTLETQSHSFKTRSDTEVLLQHFIQNGVEGLKDLNGMFAFAIWESKTERLTLARDRVGIKPLYYAPLKSGGIAFSSELTSLLAHPEVPRSLDPDGLRSLFFSDAIHPPLTAIRGVYKLAPGHFLTWSRGEISQQKPFWSFDTDWSPVKVEDNEEALVSRLRDKLSQAVESQLMSDVPLGVFLSGGLDSSLVAALAKSRAGERLKTFSIGFDNPSFDESGYARKVAATLGTEHTEEIFTEAKLLDVLDQALSCLDEPMADPSILPTWVLSRLASRTVKVALGGDGGDELWAGYPTYLAHQAASAYGMIPGGVRDHLIEPIVSALPVRHSYQSLEWKLKRFVQRWDQDARTRHLRWMSNTDLPDLDRILPHGKLSALPQIPTKFELDPLNGLLALDFTSYLPDSVLTKVDRASMAHGLEARPPILDNHFVEWSFSVPSRWKLRGRTRKYLLKRAASGLLPQEIIDRPKKGFSIPLAAWIRGPLRDRLKATLADSPLWSSGTLNRDAFAGFFDAHQSMSEDRSKPLWTLLVLDYWIKKEGIHGHSLAA